MTAENPLPDAQPSGHTVRGLIIVARDQPDLWQSLTRCFAADEGVRVFLDRRQWERRQRIHTSEADRRGADRRRPPSLENDLRRRPFMVAPK